MPLLQQNIVPIGQDNLFLTEDINYTPSTPLRASLQPFQPETLTTTIKNDDGEEQVLALTVNTEFTLPQGDTWEDYKVDFPYGPQNLRFDELSGNHQQVPRPKRAPLLVYEHPKLRTVTFSAMIADKASGGCAPGEVEIILDNLATIARNGVPCRFLYGITALPYAVALTKFSFTVDRRNMSGVPTQVSVDLQLTEKLLIQQIVTELAAIVETPTTPGSVIAAPPPDDEIPDVNPGWNGFTPTFTLTNIL